MPEPHPEVPSSLPFHKAHPLLLPKIFLLAWAPRDFYATVLSSVPSQVVFVGCSIGVEMAGEPLGHIDEPKQVKRMQVAKTGTFQGLTSAHIHEASLSHMPFPHSTESTHPTGPSHSTCSNHWLSHLPSFLPLSKFTDMHPSQHSLPSETFSETRKREGGPHACEGSQIHHMTAGRL